MGAKPARVRTNCRGAARGSRAGTTFLAGTTQGSTREADRARPRHDQAINSTESAVASFAGMIRSAQSLRIKFASGPSDFSIVQRPLVPVSYTVASRRVVIRPLPSVVGLRSSPFFTSCSTIGKHFPFLRQRFSPGSAPASLLQRAPPPASPPFAACSHRNRREIAVDLVQQVEQCGKE